MAKQPTNLREWRVSIMREKVQHHGRVVASDGERDFRIEPARRFRLIAEPVA